MWWLITSRLVGVIGQQFIRPVVPEGLGAGCGTGGGGGVDDPRTKGGVMGGGSKTMSVFLLGVINCNTKKGSQF